MNLITLHRDMILQARSVKDSKTTHFMNVQVWQSMKQDLVKEREEYG